MKALAPYLSWIKLTLQLAVLLIGIWGGFQAGSVRSQKKLAALETSVATTVSNKKDEQIVIQHETKIEYVDRVQYVDRWRTKKEKELVYVSQPLAQCRLSDDAVRLHNEARDCSLQADSTGCRVDVEMRATGTTATE